MRWRTPMMNKNFVTENFEIYGSKPTQELCLRVGVSDKLIRYQKRVQHYMLNFMYIL